MTKILRLIALLGLMVTSSVLLSIIPTPSSAYLVIWGNNSQPKVFQTLAIAPLKTPEMNVTYENITINKFQDFDKVALVLDDEGFKPSSPVTSKSYLDYQEGKQNGV